MAIHQADEKGRSMVHSLLEMLATFQGSPLDPNPLIDEPEMLHMASLVGAVCLYLRHGAHPTNQRPVYLVPWSVLLESSAFRSKKLAGIASEVMVFACPVRTINMTSAKGKLPPQ